MSTPNKKELFENIYINRIYYFMNTIMYRIKEGMIKVKFTRIIKCKPVLGFQYIVIP